MADQPDSIDVLQRVLGVMTPARAPELATAAQKARPSGKPAPRPLDLQKFGMQHDAEWLLICPARYVDYANETLDYDDLIIGNHAMLRGRVVKMEYFKKDDKQPLKDDAPKAATRLAMTIENARGQRIDIAVFGRPYFAWKMVNLNDEILIRAQPKPAFRGNHLELNNAEIVPRALKGQIVPIYPNLKVTKGERLREKVDEHLHLIGQAAAIVDAHTGWNEPSEIISFPEISGFRTPLELLQSLHRPVSVEEGEKARRASRLVSALALMRATLLRSEDAAPDPRSAIPVSPEALQSLVARLPFAITNDQKKAIEGIAASLRSPLPMSGLLSGDVGSGKTVTFLIPLVATYLCGKRAVIMTPNLLLIDQIARDLQTLFPEIPVCTITGTGIKGDPNNAVVVGNTALMGARKKNKLASAPDVLVIDEQHKFSIEQRRFLADEYTNILEATATPIPRTAALISHGAADVFLLREIPVEKRIKTEIFTKDTALASRNTILTAVLCRGEQAAVVYPLVDSTDAEDSRSTVSNALANWAKYIPEERIAVLHGKLKPDEKTSVLDAFRNGEKDLLLTSTVIEVGVTLPSLFTMLVVNAENSGVVTLHQLRGRLARHGGDGHMMLYTSDPTAESLDRLHLLVEHSDGFVLAEKDAELRGFGDLIGMGDDAQSGKTRTLFLGVNVGPREIGFAANLYRRAGRMQDTFPLSMSLEPADWSDMLALPASLAAADPAPAAAPLQPAVDGRPIPVAAPPAAPPATPSVPAPGRHGFHNLR